MTPCPAGTISVAGGINSAACTNVPIGDYRLGPTVFGTVTNGYNAVATGEYFAIPTRFG